MTRRRIVYRRPDGGVSVVVPSPRFIAELMAEGLSESAAVDVVVARDIPPDVIDLIKTDVDSIPADRTFRDAWRRDGQRPVRVDMPTARTIHRQRLEQRAAERARVLREQYLEADEDGDTARAQQIRQRVRGMRQRIASLDLDEAQTPEELAAITDVELDDQQTLRGAR